MHPHSKVAQEPSLQQNLPMLQKMVQKPVFSTHKISRDEKQEMAKRSPLINAFKLFQGNKLYRELYMLPTNGMQHSIMTTTAQMQDDIDGDSAGCPYNGHQEESSSHDTKAK